MNRSIKTNTIILEDDTATSLIYKKILERKTDLNLNNISICTSLKKAKESLIKNKYDIAFIDIQIGKKTDGLKFIKDCVNNSIIPVVLTGIRDNKILQEAYEAGALGVFLKSRENAFENAIENVVHKLKEEKINTFTQGHYYTEYQDLKTQFQYIFNNFSKINTIAIFGPEGSGKRFLAESLANYLFPEKQIISKLSENSKADNTIIIDLKKDIETINPQLAKSNNLKKIFLIPNDQLDFIQNVHYPLWVKEIIIETPFKINLPPFQNRSNDFIPLLNFFTNNDFAPEIVFPQIDNYLKNFQLKFLTLKDLINCSKQIRKSYPNGGIVSLNSFLGDKKQKTDFEIISHSFLKNIPSIGYSNAIKILGKNIAFYYYKKNKTKFRATVNEISISPTVLSKFIKEIKNEK